MIPIDKVNQYLFKAIKYFVGGHVKSYSLMKLGAPSNMQAYYRTIVILRDVQYSGDEFRIWVACYVYRGINMTSIKNIYNLKDWKAWLENNPLVKVDAFDNEMGHQQIKFVCSISGFKPQMAFQEAEDSGEISIFGEEDNIYYKKVGKNENLHTLSEVGIFAKNAIENFYHFGGDGGNDDAPDNTPQPSPESTIPVPVGAA